MLTVHMEETDLKKIADSGQCFRFLRLDERTWAVMAGTRRLELRDLGDETFDLDCPRAEYEGFWRYYFDRGTDYAALRAAVDPEDDYLTGAAQAGAGIRILRQDAWEMLCTFILSQRKNIPAIRGAVEALCARYGADMGGYRGFPTAERLAACTTEELGGCALGYRAKYIAAAAGKAASGALDLTRLAEAEDEALLEALTGVYGVGEKVASCVMLFGFHRLDAFPKDVWIHKALDQRYQGGFPYARYRGYNGVIQQYIFYYQRFLDGQLR